jgi:hypothetical protein
LSYASFLNSSAVLEFYLLAPFSSSVPGMFS